MKLLKAEINNFGSYKDLTFNFNNIGLALIQGVTGSGKSTLQDIVPWILFGATAKNGSVDDIRNWSNLEHPTIGKLFLELEPNFEVVIVRQRGKSSSYNDLYWYNDTSSTIYRGKDINETQKLLETYLKFSFEDYIAAAYFNEFSTIGSFFICNETKKREILENLTDLSFPELIKEKLIHVKKITQKIELSISSRFDKEIGRYEQLEKTKESIKRTSEQWETTKVRTAQILQEKIKTFDQEFHKELALYTAQSQEWEINTQNQLIELTEKYEYHHFKQSQEIIQCDKCGQKNNNYYNLEHEKLNYKHLIDKLSSQLNPFLMKIDKLTNKDNTYKNDYENCIKQLNPFILEYNKLDTDLISIENEIDKLSNEKLLLYKKLNSIDTLSDVLLNLRSILLQNSIKILEAIVNDYLMEFFDSEFKVIFEILNDSFITKLYKDGHECKYRQLSKGQRSILKLCFSIAIMQIASNKIGIHFDTLFFDEALDGLDDSLKQKSYRLFEKLSLSHTNILVIEHSESLKVLFNNIYHVKLKDDESQIIYD